MAGRWLVQGRIILQDGCSWLRNCIAIQFIVLQEEADLAGIVLQNLYCRRLGCREFVLQYKKKKMYCEVQWQETGLPVSQDRQLCRDTALGAAGARVGTRGARGERGARAGQAAAGEQRVRGTGVRALGRRAAGEAGTQPGRWARGLGARAGKGLCTRCTQLVFGTV